jgi:hypothetical protein
MAGDKAGPLASSGQPSGLNAVTNNQAFDPLSNGIVAAFGGTGQPAIHEGALEAGSGLLNNMPSGGSAQNAIVPTGGFKSIGVNAKGEQQYVASPS